MRLRHVFNLHIQGRSQAIRRVGSLRTKNGTLLCIILVILEHAYALADLIAKLIQILYCIKINICISSIVDVIVDLFIHLVHGPFVHSSGPFHTF